MIQGLYETHLFVENLERSIDFYKNILGLVLAHFEAERRVAFFWIGKPKAAMLGLWEKPKNEIDKRHFAFQCDTDFILHKSVDFLKSKNISPYNFLKDGTEKPMVFAWMPAIAIYFDDPDGHILEFIAIIDGHAKPELGVIPYDDWLKYEMGVTPFFKIIATGIISNSFIENNITDFQQAAGFIKLLPYGRNANKVNLETIFIDKCGTCSTKHAILKQLAIENHFEELKLFIVLFKMNSQNTPEISKTLNKYGLDYIPEAHNYLKYKNQILDYTKPVAIAIDVSKDFIEELEILPHQITDFKVFYHREYLKKWLNENVEIKYSLDEIWAIREECIYNLSMNL